MPSSKVYFTYKRKLPLSRTGLARGNGCHSSPSEGPSETPITTPDKHDAQSAKHKLANQQKNSLVSLYKLENVVLLVYNQ